MLPDLHPTTRKYPRTLKEAFPNSYETSQWLEYHQRPLSFQSAATYALSFLAAIAALILWAAL